MISGKVQIDGVEALSRALQRTGQQADDLTGAWSKVGALYAAREKDIFARGGRPRWKPLSPAYIVARRRDGFGGRPLVRTGLLRDAVTQPRPAKAGKQYAVFGPARRTAPHWVLHKHGTGRMPKRDPLPALTKAERKQVRDIIAEHILKATRGTP